MPTDKPHILLVHGAWLSASPYASLLSHLQDLGFGTTCSRLPTASNDIPPKHSLSDDTALIQRELTSLADERKAVVVLMHSYGGVVGSNALEGMGWAERQSRGPNGGVVHIIYMAAFLLPLGTCMNTSFNNQLPPWLNEDKPNGTISFKDIRNACFSDFPPNQQDYWVSQLVACPTSVTFDKITYTPYGKIPATYVVFTQDVELKKEIQEAMARGILGTPPSDAGAGDKPTSADVVEGRWDVQLEYVDGGHCAFIAKPGEVAEIVGRVWERVQSEIVVGEGI